MKPDLAEPLDRHGHRPPLVGEAQPFVLPKSTLERRRESRRRRSQAGGGAGFVTVNDRLFAPLAGLNPNDVSQGGYTWLSVTDGGATFHPGVDLNSGGSCNADEGASVVSPLASITRSVLYSASGEGNHIWLEIDDPCSPGPTYVHFDHMLSIESGVGQRNPAGAYLGQCGRTGGWDCAHLHTEFLKGPPSNGYWQWPYGWSRQQVENEYYQPAWWWNAAAALVLSGAGAGEEENPMNTTHEERMEMKSYFDIYGVDCNMDTAIMERACLAYKRDETPGPALTQEYPYGPHVRQDFTSRILEWHADDNKIYYVEVVKEQRGA